LIGDGGGGPLILSKENSVSCPKPFPSLPTRSLQAESFLISWTANPFFRHKIFNLLGGRYSLPPAPSVFLPVINSDALMRLLSSASCRSRPPDLDVAFFPLVEHESFFDDGLLLSFHFPPQRMFCSAARTLKSHEADGSPLPSLSFFTSRPLFFFHSAKRSAPIVLLASKRALARFSLVGFLSIDKSLLLH